MRRHNEDDHTVTLRTPAQPPDMITATATANSVSPYRSVFRPAADDHVITIVASAKFA